MKKNSVFLTSLFASAALFAAPPKYVFVFIGDGMSTPQRMVAEDFARKIGHGELAMNHLPYQANTRTKSANAVITDSAAAATAIACGVKTNNGMLGVDPRTNHVESVAYAAHKTGAKVGIVTSVAIVHATPAGFYAHVPNRGQSYRIALDLVHSGFEYYAGAGVYDRYDDKSDAMYRGNVFDYARKSGMIVATNRAEWAALRPGSRSWSIFDPHVMQFAIDADGSEPSLADLVAKGIEVLDNEKGFFMMCEGGKVDYAGHANDAATNLRDVLALDDAVKVAIAFQEKHPEETLIVTTGDHETGGLSMGFAGCGGRFRVELLARQKISTEMFSEEMKRFIAERKCEVALDDVKGVLSEKFGFVFPGEETKKNDPMLLSKADVKALEEALAKDVKNVKNKLKDTTAHDVPRAYSFAQAAKNVLNAHAGVGWSSYSHTALPTFTTAKGPGAEILVGMEENSDLGTRLKALYAK